MPKVTKRPDKGPNVVEYECPCGRRLFLHYPAGERITALSRCFDCAHEWDTAREFLIEKHFCGDTGNER